MDRFQSYREQSAYISLMWVRHGEFIRISLILAALTLIFFIRPIVLNLVPSASNILAIWPVFELGDVKVQNLLLSDVVVQSEPWILFNQKNIQMLQLPLWNPYCGGGVPHFANMFFSVFFFLSWPLYIIGVSKYTLLFLYFGKIYLAGFCGYYYLRSIGIRIEPATIGSLAYMFIGYNVVWLYYPPSNLVFILPAMLYLIEKIIVAQSGIKYFIALMAVTATGIFAGFPVMFFHITFISYIYLIYRLFSTKAANKAQLIKNYILFYTIGVALSAIQLIPFLEYLFYSNAWASRSGANHMLDWHAAILNIQPEFYGSPSIYQIIPYYAYSFTNYNESASGYVGIVMFCLATYAITASYKDSLMRFYLLIIVWAIGVVYGLPGVFDLTVSLPFFSKANNYRLLFLIGFSIVVLGSIGLNQIMDCSEHEKRHKIVSHFISSGLLVLGLLLSLTWANRNFLSEMGRLNLVNVDGTTILAQNILVSITAILVLITTALICVFIRYNACRRYRIISLALLFTLVFFETGFHGILFEPAVEERYFQPQVKAFDWISSKNELYRTTSISPNDSIGAYPVNAQITYGIYDIRDYDVLENKYYWPLFNEFCHGMMRGWTSIEEIDGRFLNFMGVRWIFSRSNLTHERGNLINSNIKLVGTYTNYYLFENKAAFPRAFVAHKASYEPDDSRIIGALRNPANDWVSNIILSGEGKAIDYPAGRSDANVTKYDCNYIKINVDSEHPGFLVLSDAYYPGWYAYVNGNRANILRANYAFRAVEVTRGKSVVEFKYEPRSLYLGCALTAASMIIVLVIILGRKIRGIYG
jgi:hypothetical protein